MGGVTGHYLKFSFKVWLLGIQAMNNSTAVLVCCIPMLEAPTLDGGLQTVVLLLPKRNHLDPGEYLQSAL